MCPEARHASAMRASCSNRCRVSSAAQWATGATRTASASIAFQSITHPRRVTVAPSQRAPTGWRSSVLSACADNARSPQNTSHCKSASMCRRKCTLRTCAPRCTPTLFHRWSSFPSPPLGHSSINPGGGASIPFRPERFCAAGHAMNHTAVRLFRVVLHGPAATKRARLQIVHPILHITANVSRTAYVNRCGPQLGWGAWQANLATCADRPEPTCSACRSCAPSQMAG